MSAFVIARSTDSDAQVAFDEAWALAEREHPGSGSRPVSGADGSAVMFKALAEHPHIGTNGGTAAGLIGSYGTVASRIVHFYEAGIDTFLLQAQPLEAELARFAEEVVPRVRARLDELTAATWAYDRAGWCLGTRPSCSRLLRLLVVAE
jgi:alkanesulfonate monooxygenase